MKKLILAIGIFTLSFAAYADKSYCHGSKTNIACTNILDHHKCNTHYSFYMDMLKIKYYQCYWRDGTCRDSTPKYHHCVYKAPRGEISADAATAPIDESIAPN